MQRKTPLLFLTTLGGLSLLASCGGGASSSSISEAPSLNPTLQALRQGFRVEGTIEINESYYSDRNYQVPDLALSDTTTRYRYELNFEDSANFTGVDRRYYQVFDLGDGETQEAYYYGENSYNNNGYASLIYLDYNNELVNDYAVDSNGELIPYANNGLLNPFKLLQRGDFHEIEGGFMLDNAKTSVFLDGFFSLLDGYQDNIVYETKTFAFGDSTLESATFISYNIDDGYSSTVPSDDDPLHQTYIRRNYQIDMEFSEVGSATSHDLIAVEPEKEENAPLKAALENMVAQEEVTVQRRITPYIDGEYVGEDNYLNIYYMGEEEGIYSQNYVLAPDEEVPTAPSASDFILKPAIAGGRLRVYQLDDTTGNFILNSSNFTSLDNVYYYADQQYDLSYLDANIFNINEDGSYSPTVDNLPYITRDIFMSYLDTFTPVDNGYVNSVRIYVNEEATCIDHIDIQYADHLGYSGEMVISYSDLGDSHPSFAINY